VITGQVKVEYAFETVRVRIYLPQWGETWFFIDKSTTLEDFLGQVRKEDNFLTNVAILEFKNGQCNPCNKSCEFSIIESKIQTETAMIPISTSK
jgi:hypothetical protein